MAEPALVRTDDYGLGHRHQEQHRLRRLTCEITPESRTFLGRRAGVLKNALRAAAHVHGTVANVFLDHPATLVIPDMFFQVAGRKSS